MASSVAPTGSVAQQATEGLSGTGAVQGSVAPPPSTVPAGAPSAPVEALHNATLPPAPLGEAAQGAVQAAPQSMAEGASQVAGAVASSMPVDSSFTWGGYFQAIGVLFLLLAAIWGVIWLVRKYGKFNFMPQPGAFPRNGMRLEAQLPLGPRKGLMVVRFLNRRLLLGVTDHQITLLKETGDHDEEDSLDFKDVMAAARRQDTDS